MAADRNGDRESLVSLQQAADRLQVHYMTAYRWVRRGYLPAFKAGGRIRVRTADIDRYLHSREVDTGLPTPGDRKTDWPRHIDRLTTLLLQGKGVEAGALVRKVVADGATAGDAYIRLLTPALHRIGDAWAAGRIGVAEEHRASEIAGALVARFADHFRRRGPRRGTAVTVTPPGDLHRLASVMVADFLRAAGFEVHHLGPSVPVDDLQRFLRAVAVDVLAVSVTTPGQDPAELQALVRAAPDGRDVLVVVGGQAADPEVVEAAGAVHVRDLASLYATVVPAEAAPHGPEN